MSSTDHPTMHKECQEAECEHVIWLEDIGRWSTEHRRAAAMLLKVQAGLLDQSAALEAHAETVRAGELRARQHERRIADHERGGSEVDNDKLTELHQEFQAEHDQAREAHQRIKLHHGMVMGEVWLLIEKLEAPM
jgi:hypothetical protein